MICFTLFNGRLPAEMDEEFHGSLLAVTLRVESVVFTYGHLSFIMPVGTSIGDDRAIGPHAWPFEDGMLYYNGIGYSDLRIHTSEVPDAVDIDPDLIGSGVVVGLCA